jgi:hypothetical protein
MKMLEKREYIKLETEYFSKYISSSFTIHRNDTEYNETSNRKYENVAIAIVANGPTVRSNGYISLKKAK